MSFKNYATGDYCENFKDLSTLRWPRVYLYCLRYSQMIVVLKHEQKRCAVGPEKIYLTPENKYTCTAEMYTCVTSRVVLWVQCGMFNLEVMSSRPDWAFFFIIARSKSKMHASTYTIQPKNSSSYYYFENMILCLERILFCKTLQQIKAIEEN